MQSVSEMAPLDIIDTLRQLIETFRCANFSENTSLGGNELLFSEAHCLITQIYTVLPKKGTQCLKLQFARQLERHHFYNR